MNQTVAKICAIAIILLWNGHIRQYVKAGNDVEKAKDMKKAIDSYSGVRICRASVVKVDTSAQDLHNSMVEKESSFATISWWREGPAREAPDWRSLSRSHLRMCQLASCTKIANLRRTKVNIMNSVALNQVASSYSKRPQRCKTTRTLASTFLTPERIPCMALCTNIRPSYIPSKKNLEGLSQKECMEYPTAEPGWALKKNKKTGRFSEYVKEYLLKQAVFDG